MIKKIEKKDIGIATAVMALSHAISSFYSSSKITNEITYFKNEFQESLIERERYFVRKTDLNPVLSRMDEMNKQLILLNEKMSDLSELEKGSDSMVSCSNFFPHKEL